MSNPKRYSINVTVETVNELDDVQTFDGLRVYVSSTQEFYYWDKDAEQFILEGGGSGPGPSPTPPLTDVLNQGKIVFKGQSIDFQGGGTPTPTNVGSIYGGGTGDDYFHIDGNLIRLGGNSSSVKMGGVLTLEGTFESFVLGGASSQITWRDAGNLKGRMGFTGSELQITNSAGGTISLNGVIGSLPVGTNTAIISTDTWIQALVKLQAQITALQP